MHAGSNRRWSEISRVYQQVKKLTMTSRHQLTTSKSKEPNSRKCKKHHSCTVIDLPPQAISGLKTGWEMTVLRYSDQLALLTTAQSYSEQYNATQNNSHQIITMLLGQLNSNESAQLDQISPSSIESAPARSRSTWLDQSTQLDIDYHGSIGSTQLDPNQYDIPPI
ncbi:BEACH domain-containing protein lvsC-like [Dorcoceras hygrometricum]|uniref:BEACH domain-containing protein lvsC-like n=1 Tax=Dorcoceras hygrometricum TaxID=472368 RepID=A0A2Z7CAN0_9LAMI|nr:BEACH domain-containing protein lvsC-like [Dorcoceras hygrometricum]